MPNQAGTIETVLQRLSEALQPLADELNIGFLHDMGLGVPPAWQSSSQLNSALQSVRSASGALPGAVQQLAQAIAADDTGDIIAKGVKLGQKIAEIIASVVQTANAIKQLAQGDGTLSGPQKTALQNVANEFFPRLAETMVVRLLEEKLPQLAAILSMTGLAESMPQNQGSDDPTAPPFVRRSLHLDRLVDFFKDPKKYASDLYDWGKPGFDGSKFLPRIQTFLESIDLPATIINAGPQPPILEAAFLAFQANKAFNPPALGFELRFPGSQPITRNFDLPGPWSLDVNFNGSFSAGVQGAFQPPASLTLQPPSGTLSLTTGATLVAQHPNRPLLLIGLPGGTRLEAGKFSAGFAVEAAWNSSDGNATANPTASFSLENGKLRLDFSGGDGFLSEVIPFEAVEATFSLKAELNAKSGIRFEGSGGVELVFPAHISIGPITIDRLYFVGKLGQPKPLSLELSSAINLSLGPLAASVDRLGAIAEFDFPGDGKGNLGPVNFGLKFKPPNGVGLSIDAGAVSGGGYLYFDFDNEEYAGALELSILSIVTVKAIGLITTRMPDGSKGFSLLIIITAEFGTGIQLGFGFTLLGVGGLLGLNRTMRLEVIANGIRTGGLDSVMFPQNVVENAPRIISDLKNYFPPENGHFLIGPMAKIGWGTPTLISLSIGIVIEIPPGNIGILGILKVALPTEEAALILIQVQFIGAIEPTKSRVWFFASLYGSRVIFLTIEGDMGLLMAFGDDPNFVISVGGFHPSFTPPPLPFPSPRRVAVSILNTDWARIRVEGYFAVTSNTVQFGARAELYFGFDVANVQGHLQFDALFQFSPFYFIISISASVELKVFGIGLFSVRLSFSLEGPTPWRAKGSASISLLFFDVSIDFDTTWGEHHKDELPPIAVLPLLEKEFQKTENWKAELPVSNRLGVTLRPLGDGSTETLVLHPAGYLHISQRGVPLSITVDKVGSQKASDGNKFTVTAKDGTGFGKKGDAREQFAIAQYQNLKDAEKLSRPAYQKEVGGLDLSVEGQQLASSRAVHRTVRYELEIIDTPKVRFNVQFFVGWLSGLFTHFLRGNAVARSAYSQAKQAQLQPFKPDAKVNIQSEGYAVAFQENNKAYGGGSQTAVFTTEAQARDFLLEKAAKEPLVAEQLHVIPQHEMA